MKIKDHMENCFGIKDPANYMIINFATDGIKTDAKIVQATTISKDKKDMYYVHGGNPRLNHEFTKISSLVYEDEALDPKDVENTIVDRIQDEDIQYIVYNNATWNNRLLKNNEWTRMQQMFTRIPCFALSDYEVVRRAFGDTLFDFGDEEKKVDFSDVCSIINSRSKSAPKGNRVTIYANMTSREIDVDSIPSFNTESESLLYVMNEIMKKILESGMNRETYKP